MPRRSAATLATAIICLFTLLQFASLARASSIGHKYAEATKTSSSHWDGVRVRMEIRRGSLSSGDAEAGLFIQNALWVYTNGDSDDEWVEAGYTRGWNSQDIVTGYWASRRWSETQEQYVYAEHKAVNCVWTSGDMHWFKIMHHSGTTTGDCAWRVFIDGDPVVSGDGVNITTSHEYPYARMMDAGIEVTASSGKLGTASDWCDLNGLSATTDEEASWSNFSDPNTYVDSGYDLHGAWSAYPTDFTDYRNW